MPFGTNKFLVDAVGHPGWSNLSTKTHGAEFALGALCSRCNVQSDVQWLTWSPLSYRYVSAIVVVTITLRERGNSTQLSSTLNPSAFRIKSSYDSTVINSVTVNGQMFVSKGFETLSGWLIHL